MQVDRPPLAVARARLPDRLPVLVLVVASLVVLLPFVFLPVLPLVDLPDHLARLHVLGAPAGSPLLLSYVPHWALMPDLGADLVYMALRGVFSPEVVLRICLVGSLAGILVAMWRIQVLLYGATTYAMAAAPLLITGLPVFMGYINYIMSVAVCFAGLALYVGWRDRLSAGRVAVLSCVATLAWVCHIAGFAVFGLLLGVMHLWGVWRGGAWRVLRAGAPLGVIFGPGLVLLVFAERQVSQLGIHYRELLKLRFLFAANIISGTSTDIILSTFVLAGFIILASRRVFALASIIRPAAIVLGVLILVCPWQIGDAVDVDSRMMLPLVAILLAGTSVRLRGGRAALAIWLSALLVIDIFHVRSFVNESHANEEDVSAFRALDKKLPQGAALLVTRDTRKHNSCSAPGAIAPSMPFRLLHLASFAVIDRAVYTPFLFTSRGMQPLRAAKPPFPASAKTSMGPTLDLLVDVTRAGGPKNFAALPSVDAEIAEEFDNLGFPPFWPEEYQALLVLHGGCVSNPLPQMLELIGNGSHFSLFRLKANER